MGRREILISFVLALSGVAFASDIHNPALTPVVEKTKPAGGTMEFVRNGELRFCIVADRKMEEKRLGNSRPNSIPTALALLDEAFGRCTGAKPQVFDPKEVAAWSKFDCVIALGDQPLVREQGVDVFRLPLEGFAVKTFPKGIVLAGLDSTLIKGWNWNPLDYKGASLGTVWAALDFIERFLGVRYYFPGEWGTVFPQVRDLRVAPVHYEDAPYFRKRHTQYCFWREFAGKGRKELWAKYLGRGVDQNAMGLRWRAGGTDPDFGMHAPDSESMAKAFPDRLEKIFYKSPSGKLWYRKGSNIGSYFDCFHEDFEDALIEAWKTWYGSGGKVRKGAGGSYVNNTWANFGVCDTMLAPQDYMGDPAVRTNRLVTSDDFRRAAATDDRAIMANVYGCFYRRLATKMKRELPGRRLGVMAYYNARNAPTDPRFVPLPDNVDVCVCDGGLLSFIADPKARKKSKDLFREWRVALGGRPPERMWLYSHGDPLAAGITPEYLGEVVRLLGEDFGRGGVFFDYETKGMWFLFYGYYAYAKCSWNPLLDVDACLAEMWRLLYPKAGATLDEFHRLLKRDCEKHLMTLGGGAPPYPLADLDRLEALLRKAAAEIGDETSVEWRRFLILKDWFEPAIAARREKERKRAAGEAVKDEGQADVDPGRPKDLDFGRLEDGVFTVSKDTDRAFELVLANDVATYVPSVGKWKGRLNMSDLSNVFDNYGFSGYARWFDLTVNGRAWLEEGHRTIGGTHPWISGTRHGYETPFTLGGADGVIRLYLKPGCDRLLGEIEFAEPGSVRSSELRLAAMPSHNSRLKQPRGYYWRQARTAGRELYPARDEPGERKEYALEADEDWVLLQDGNFDGSAEGKGVGPVWVGLDRSVCASVKVRIGLNARQNYKDAAVAASLKPGTKVFRFAVWQKPHERHSNGEVFRRFAGDGAVFKEIPSKTETERTK